MSIGSGSGSGEGPDDGQNPFKGTPFEQFFAGGMPGLGGAGGGAMPDLQALF
eukprot:gene4002-4735_t